MDIESLKEALGDEKFATLKTYVSDLIGQRDAARNESITGRKSLKDKVAALETQQTALLEKLGLSSAEELESLPDVKGMADAARQLDARIKRAERERDEAKKQAEEAGGKWRSSLQRAAIADALSGHEFVARDIVETFVNQRLVWEGDDILFKTEDGKLVPVKDGVAGIAKTRPELLKPTGTGGAGVRQSNAGSGGGKTMTREQYEAMSPSARAAVNWGEVKLTD
ncbi:MAG: hypothetical protein RLZZ524_661 [Pseudomonadota bacterium]|jgi:hypothetical protein